MWYYLSYDFCYWNIMKRAIIISTEAGRMYRPLLIVDYDQINS